MQDVPERPRGERFPRSDRVLHRADFLRIQQGAARVHTPHFVIVVGTATGQRLGVTVTRRIAGAVGRNRVRRCVKEVFRRNRALFPPSCDAVVIARRGAQTLGYSETLAEFESARMALVRAAATAVAGGST